MRRLKWKRAGLDWRVFDRSMNGNKTRGSSVGLGLTDYGVQSNHRVEGSPKSKETSLVRSSLTV